MIWKSVWYKKPVMIPTQLFGNEVNVVERTRITIWWFLFIPIFIDYRVEVGS